MSDEGTAAVQRTRNRWGEGERLRGEILDGAGRVLSELGGGDGLTIRGVARVVGIAPASIYQHFADREALVRGLIAHEFDRLRDLMRAADEAVDAGDAVGRLRARLHAYCAFAVDNPGHYRLMLGNGAERPAPDRPPAGPLVDVIDTLRVAFERCAEAGHALRVPADRAAVMVFVGAHGRVALLHSNPGEQHARAVTPFVDEFVDLLFV
ncbi:transcriptional regulator, TetR family [Actinokineospora spheciospongiae]|uniref:Transcriptional regulator, TetR family n=1 Tax=Actinokineospora spheciospongiae TaxID=909613 RepID=W7IJW7_9PSEU|nr:TetR/AcrR family transcriptional regulator [Actinokineospora spheciospongiae]EWC61135.1 transcriptional regulator, TetR family [Actinokineospora spheciospongiae]